MNQTPNYQLNQWEADDKIQRVDFNADNAKIDAAIAAAVTQFAAGSYRGTGEHGLDHPNSLTFDFPPKVVIVQAGLGAPGVLAILTRGLERTQVIYTAQYSEHRCDTLIASWNGNTVSWYLLGNLSDPYANRAQANDTATYHYFAIG